VDLNGSRRDKAADWVMTTRGECAPIDRRGEQSIGPPVVTMLAGGLWHGPAWTFSSYGARFMERGRWRSTNTRGSSLNDLLFQSRSAGS
jgi:hypothetical protein